MPLLGFDYDSSYPDTDPYEPQSGGCCTWLPFFNQGMVELPITMPHDHNLFVILAEKDEQVWVEKAEFLRERGGMALIVTHPDYFVDERIPAAYERLVRRYADAPGEGQTASTSRTHDDNSNRPTTANHSEISARRRSRCGRNLAPLRKGNVHLPPDVADFHP